VKLHTDGEVWMLKLEYTMQHESDQIHVMPPQGERTPIPIVQNAGWVPEPIWVLWSKENLMLGIKPQPSSL
jgi:hypothetical protein